VLIRRFGLAAEMACEERLGQGVELQAVLRTSETVPLIGIEYVGNGFAGCLHRGDYLFALGLLDAGIVGALADQQRALDAVGEEQGRSLVQKLRLRLRVTDAVIR